MQERRDGEKESDNDNKEGERENGDSSQNGFIQREGWEGEVVHKNLIDRDSE